MTVIDPNTSPKIFDSFSKNKNNDCPTRKTEQTQRSEEKHQLMSHTTATSRLGHDGGSQGVPPSWLGDSGRIPGSKLPLRHCKLATLLCQGKLIMFIHDRWTYLDKGKLVPVIRTS